MKRALVISLLLALALPATAAAHARLLFSTPADGQVLDSAPHALVVHFDDGVTAGPGIAAVDATGRSLLAGTPHAHGKILTIPLRTSRDRTYDVRWSVISDDGHNVTGVVAFTVRGATVQRQRTLTVGSTNPPASSVIERWLFFAGALVGAGAALFLVAVASTRRVALLAAVAFAVAAVAALLERAGVPGSTRFAHAMTVAAIAAAAGAVLAAVDLRRVLLLPALVLLAAPVVGGHAFDDGVPRIQVLVDFLHLAGAAAWTGGLAALALTLGSARRFSRLALPAVAVIAVTGVLRAISELTSISQLWSTGYGRAIVIKSVLFVLLLGLGYLARTRLLAQPALLRRSVAVELSLLACLVVAVAFLTALPPGRALASPHVIPPTATSGAAPPPPHGALTLAGHTGSDAVAVAVREQGGHLDVTTTVLNNQGNGADGVAVTANGVAAQRCGFGCYRATIRPARTLLLRVNGAPVSFALPPLPAADGRTLLARIGARFMQTRNASFHERLSSGPGQTVVSDWRIAAPDSLAFTASDGTSGIIIGGRRWDRQNGGKWVESPQAPHVAQPQLPWAKSVYDVSVLPPDGTNLVRVSFVDPATPAWYTVSADPSTMRLHRIEMVAPAHFMQDTYRAYDTTPAIAPPR